ncbi:AAEL007435-PA, partial [Aedes aegypti]
VCLSRSGKDWTRPTGPRLGRGCSANLIDKTIRYIQKLPVAFPSHIKYHHKPVTVVVII